MSIDPKDESLHSDDGRPRRPLDWARAQGAEDLVEMAMRAAVARRRKRRMGRFGSIAAVILLAGGTFWLMKVDPKRASISQAPHFVTKPVMRELADGSLVELGSQAEVRVDYSERVRRVFLERGEAHFQVAKNARRPFVVVAGSVEVNAVGTAFSVQLAADKVDVVVTEGRVAVAQPAQTASAVHVDAGQGVVVQSARPSEEIEQAKVLDPSELTRRLAWRIPMLELNLTPLGEVIPVVAEHAGVRIALADPSWSALKLTGRLRANNLAVLLQILESSYGLYGTKTATGELVLDRAH